MTCLFLFQSRHLPVEPHEIDDEAYEYREQNGDNNIYATAAAHGFAEGCFTLSLLRMYNSCPHQAH